MEGSGTRWATGNGVVQRGVRGVRESSGVPPGVQERLLRGQLGCNVCSPCWQDMQRSTYPLGSCPPAAPSEVAKYCTALRTALTCCWPTPRRQQQCHHPKGIQPAPTLQCGSSVPGSIAPAAAQQHSAVPCSTSQYGAVHCSTVCMHRRREVVSDGSQGAGRCVSKTGYARN
jgi:hypothetical protein